MAHDQKHNAQIARLLREARRDIPNAKEQQAVSAGLTNRVAGGDQGQTLPFDVPPPSPGASTLGRTIIAGSLVVGGLLLVLLNRSQPVPAPKIVVHRDMPAATTIVTSDEVGATHHARLSALKAQEPAVPQDQPLMPNRVTTNGPRKLQRSTATGPTESRLIEEARSLVRSEPQRALALTDQHLRLYRAGELAPEREVLAIEALARLGKRSQAVARANAFRSSHPGSIHASRIEAALAERKSSAP